MFTFNYGQSLRLPSKQVIYRENSAVQQNGRSVFFLIKGRAMVARRTGDGFFRMGMGTNTLLGLQDAVDVTTRAISAITLEEAEIYSWKVEDFFRNISVDILLARAATLSLCQELRYLNDRQERTFSSEENETDVQFQVTDDMETAGALYGLAFQKDSEEIPEQIIAMFGKVFEPGDILIRENDQTDDIFILYAGTVVVSKGGNFICNVGSGEIIGEMSHFEKKPRAATVTAQTQARALQLQPQNFNVLYQLHPNWSINLLKSLCRRIRAAYQKM